MVNASRIIDIGRQVLSEFSEKNVGFMAAGLAYNAFVSLVPVLLLLLLVVNLIGGGLEQRLVTTAQSSLPAPIADVIIQIFGSGPTATGASLIGLIVLLWGSLKIFRGLDTAFSEIYETEGANSFTDKLKDGVTVFGGLVIAILATIGVTSFFATFSNVIPFLGLLTPLLLVIGLTVAFLPIYYIFPDTDLDWQHVLPGATFAAIGWGVLQGLFQVYLMFTSGGTTSLFSGVIVVLTWLYFSGLVLLLGAVLNAVLGGYASGTPGGIGRGATSREIEREETLNRDELADYLRDLRRDLTGRYEGMGSTDARTERPRSPLTGTQFELVEQSSGEDEREWAVVLRWRTDTEPDE